MVLAVRLLFTSSVCAAGTMDDEGGHRRGTGKRTRGAGGGYSAGMRARSGSSGGRAHKEAADPMREAAAQDEDDTNAIERAQREARIVQLAITCVVGPFPECFPRWVAHLRKHSSYEVWLLVGNGTPSTRRSLTCVFPCES